MRFKKQALIFGSWIAFSTLTAGNAQAMTFSLAHEPSAEVRFTVAAPLDDIVGISHRLSGEVTFQADTLVLTSGEIKVDPSSFRTGIALRDEDLRDQFFEVQRFPEIALTLQKLSRPSTTMLAPGTRLEAEISGTLALHGATRAVMLPTSLERSADGNVITIHASFEVRFQDFGISRPQRLFLKLGDVARIEVRATFATAPTSGEAANPAAATAPAAPTLPPPPVARANARKTLPKDLLSKVKKHEPRFAFPAETAAGRGERLLHDPTIGGVANAISCASCHSNRDERTGIVEDGAIRPNHSLFDVGRRAVLWQGFAKTVGKAASICAKMFMLKPEGLTASQESDVETYLARVSPDQVAPPLDYRVLSLTRKTELAHPTDGNAKNGERLLAQHCEACHAIGAPRPPLTPGLYEADYLVQRVRHLEGTDAHQMPPLTIDRLTDSELRDIVTYLAGKPDEQIFRRNRTAKAATP